MYHKNIYKVQFRLLKLQKSFSYLREMLKKMSDSWEHLSRSELTVLIIEETSFKNGPVKV